MNRWLLALVLWLAFNASVLLFAWLSCRDDEGRPSAEFADLLEWDREMARWMHPAGNRDPLS